MLDVFFSASALTFTTDFVEHVVASPGSNILSTTAFEALILHAFKDVV